MRTTRQQQHIYRARPKTGLRASARRGAPAADARVEDVAAPCFYCCAEWDTGGEEGPGPGIMCLACDTSMCGECVGKEAMHAFNRPVSRMHEHSCLLLSGQCCRRSLGVPRGVIASVVPAATSAVLAQCARRRAHILRSRDETRLALENVLATSGAMPESGLWVGGDAHAWQCPVCDHGPVQLARCDDLMAHHGQCVVTKTAACTTAVFVHNNCCRKCGFGAPARDEWVAYDGDTCDTRVVATPHPPRMAFNPFMVSDWPAKFTPPPEYADAARAGGWLPRADRRSGRSSVDDVLARFVTHQVVSRSGTADKQVVARATRRLIEEAKEDGYYHAPGLLLEAISEKCDDAVEWARLTK